MLAALRDDPDVRGITDLRVAAGTVGGTSVVTHTYDAVGVPAPMVLQEGTAPVTDGDAVLGPTTAEQLGASIGSRFTLHGDRGSQELRVTGIGFTVESSTSGYDRGAWVTPGDHDRLFTGFKEHAGLLALAPGVHRASVTPRLQVAASTAAGGEDVLIITPFVPPQFGEIKNVRALPVLLGVFLALLAVGAVAHALMVSVRRRRRDIAILRAIGMTRRHCRRIVTAQATAITIIGLVVGVPLGLAAGRVLWRLAADRAPLRYDAPPSLWLVVLVIPLALVVGNLLATWPGHRATRVRVSQVLATD